MNLFLISLGQEDRTRLGSTGCFGSWFLRGRKRFLSQKRKKVTGLTTAAGIWVREDRTLQLESAFIKEQFSSRFYLGRDIHVSTVKDVSTKTLSSN